MRGRVSGLATVIAVLLWSGAATADTIVVTSGFATLYWDGSLAPFELSGAGTHLLDEHHGSGTSGFAAGQTVVLRGSLSPNQNRFLPRPQTVNGIFYPSVFLRGTLDFLGAPFVAPSAPMNAEVTFTTPFTMTGQMTGCADFDCAGGALFSTTLTGSGTASTSQRAITSSGQTFWINRTADTYRFEAQSPSPTPEPASVFLLGLGMAAGVGRRLWRKDPGR